MGAHVRRSSRKCFVGWLAEWIIWLGPSIWAGHLYRAMTAAQAVRSMVPKDAYV